MHVVVHFVDVHRVASTAKFVSVSDKNTILLGLAKYVEVRPYRTTNVKAYQSTLWAYVFAHEFVRVH